MWIVNVTVMDGERHQSVVTLNLPSATAYADAVAVANDFASEVLSLTNGRIESVTLTDAGLGLPAGNPAVGAGAGDVEVKGVFSFWATGAAGTFAYRMSIPALKLSLMELNTDRLDQTQGAVSDFINKMTIGFDNVAENAKIIPVDTRLYPLVALISAKEAYGKKRKPLANA